MKFLKKYIIWEPLNCTNNISQFLFITKSREDDELYNFRYIYILLYVKSVDAHEFNASCYQN